MSVIDSLWPSDAKWWQRHVSTLAQVMVCFLMAPSHYLSQCWLIISKVQWQSPGAVSQEIPLPSINKIQLKNNFVTFRLNLWDANTLSVWLLWLHVTVASGWLPPHVVMCAVCLLTHCPWGIWLQSQISTFQTHFNDKYLFLWNCYQVNATTPHLSLVFIGSDNGLVSSGNKPLTEPTLT